MLWAAKVGNNALKHLIRETNEEERNSHREGKGGRIAFRNKIITMIL
jgi:hypothetical protein